MTSDEHPMWAARGVLARRHSGIAGLANNELVCRIALTAADMRALLGEGAPPDGTTRIAAWDTPEVLLADDPDLVALLATGGITVPHATATFAQRDDDARDRLAAATHRFEDHGEEAHGSALDARVAVVVAWGAARVRALLARLAREVATNGLVIDVREPHDVRVFVLPTVARACIVIVREDGVGKPNPNIDATLARAIAV